MNSESKFRIDLKRKPNAKSISNSDNLTMDEINASFSLIGLDRRPFCEKPRAVTNGRIQIT